MKKGPFRPVRRQFSGLETRILGLERQTGHDGRADQVGGEPLGSGRFRCLLGPVLALPRS
jgi:hypothetical protein